jgi:hypothetical protein
VFTGAIFEMNPAVHAQRILEAWNLADTGRFNAALDDALSFSNPCDFASPMACEQQELLHAVAERLCQTGSPATCIPQSTLEAGLRLLRHLESTSVRQPKFSHAAVTA